MRKSWLLLALVPALLPAATDFTRDIAPVLESRCQLCHGAKQQMSGLRLDDGSASSKGPKILERITSTKSGVRMPPIGAPLTAAEVAKFKSWIEEGAKWPAGYKPGSQAGGHWSFQPIQRPTAPQVRDQAWVRNPIDAFLLARLEKEGLHPSPEAPKATLLRRLSLDLTGLPPTPQETQAFLADSAPGAYERAVDRLLASEHYGEKWARPWLDLARYADSDGYEKDQVRTHAWRYRKWVIDSLNADLPFDQFTIQQLAGDLLPNATTSQLVATGFHRNALTNREAGVDRAEARFEQLVNRVNTTSTTWLGLTVGCAQCHNHKYDPIQQKDFYRIFAYFDSEEERDIEAPMPGERDAYLAALPAYLAKRGHVLEQYNIAALQAYWEDKLRAAIDNPGKDVEWDFSMTSMRAMFDFAERTLKTPPEKRSAYDQRRLTDYFLSTGGPATKETEDLRARLREAREKIQEAAAELPPLTMAYTMTNSPDYKGTFLRVKGDYRTMGDPIEPGTLSVLPQPPAGARTRLDLAKWLVSNDNPLTPRVTVNRAWQEFFGRGIVRTSEDFGTQGEKPTHPELLDWLASQFLADNWSLKKLHRLIVTSAAYRQGTRVDPDTAAKDPDNSLLSRQTRLRLPAELIRDSALAASGLLDHRIGGPSIRPYQPPGVAELGYGGSIKWRESEGAEKYRRGLYVHFQRTTPYPQLMNFDAPDSNVACSRRRSSNSPLQSLNLLNDPVFFEAAQSLAKQALQAGPDFASRLDRAWLLAIGRTPNTKERERMARLADDQASILRNEPTAAESLAPPGTAAAKQTEAATWTALARVILNLDEFITRE